jgi:hypothetical protein
MGVPPNHPSHETILVLKPMVFGDPPWEAPMYQVVSHFVLVVSLFFVGLILMFVFFCRLGQ